MGYLRALAALALACASCAGPPALSDRADAAIVAASTLVPARPAVNPARPRRPGDGSDVLTAHNDVARTGWNARETLLSPAALRARTFGKLFDVHVDGQVFAQPLIVTGLALPRIGRRNVAYIATEHDSVYAVDADTGAPYWQHTFGGCCGVSAVPASMLYGCRQIAPFVGISATPVIDRRAGTIYVVAKSVERRGPAPVFHTTLYALSLATGEDRVAPAEVTARVELSARGAFEPGSSFAHSLKRYLRGGALTFDAQAQFSRPGLLLANGNVYIAFASHCDRDDAHGWLFAYDASTLRRRAAFTTIGDWHDSNGGGIWQSGFGIAADRSGAVYVTTGNGPFDADTGGRDYGDSLLALSPDLARVIDSFTPSTQRELERNDADFGGGGLLVLPDRPGPYGRLGIVSSKLRSIVLVDRAHLGGYHRGGPDDVVQIVGGLHDTTRWCIGTCGGPAYYAGPHDEVVFNAWTLDALRAYRIDRHGVRPRLIEIGHSTFTFPGLGGATPSVSSDGRRAGTAIVWATTRPGLDVLHHQPIQLLAFDAANLAHELYRGDATLWRNRYGIPFLTPTIANGKVYVGGDRDVSVFGLRSSGL
jgi:outer membrane protein assembly factor BamB